MSFVQNGSVTATFEGNKQSSFHTAQYEYNRYKIFAHNTIENLQFCD
jgi:hypothetical protein